VRTASNQAKGRTVGLDKPCRSCGRPVYYNYQSPVEGLCGRCADRKPKSSGKVRIRTTGVKRPRRTFGSAMMVVAFLCGAAAAILALHFLG
jgi:hypothetical protein